MFDITNCLHSFNSNLRGNKWDCSCASGLHRALSDLTNVKFVLKAYCQTPNVVQNQPIDNFKCVGEYRRQRTSIVSVETRSLRRYQTVTFLSALLSRKWHTSKQKQQRPLPTRFQPFQPRPVWSGFKKLGNKTNRKRFFANRTRNNSTNQTNLKRLIPIQHDLSFFKIIESLQIYAFQWFIGSSAYIVTSQTSE